MSPEPSFRRMPESSNKNDPAKQAKRAACGEFRSTAKPRVVPLRGGFFLLDSGLRRNDGAFGIMGNLV